MQNVTRDFKRDYNTENAKARERYRAGIRRANRKALEEAQRDYLYEEKRGIGDYVICRVCGAKLRALVGKHLSSLHGLSAGEYHKKFPNAPLTSSNTVVRLSRSLMRGKHELLGVAQRNTSSVRCHTGEKPVREWDIVRPRVAEGKTSIEIARIVNRHKGRVKVICRQLGLTTVGRYDLGSVMTMGRLLKLYEATELGRKRFGPVFGVPSGLIHNISKTNLRPRIETAHAASVIKVRDEMILGAYGMSKQRGGQRAWGPNTTRILRSLVPDFRRVSDTLRDLLDQSRRFFRAQPKAGAEQWQNWLCDQTRREVAGLIPGKRFTSFLPLAAELEEFIDPPALRTSGGLRRMSMAILAVRFGVGPTVTATCGRARPLPPRDLKDWILKETGLRQTPSKTPSTPAAPTAKNPTHAGRPRVTEVDYRLAMAFRDRTGCSWGALAKEFDYANWTKGGKGRKDAADRIRVNVKRLRSSTSVAAPQLMGGDK